MKEIHKITTGYVVQRFNAETGQYLGQDFIASDECSYEDGKGNVLDEADFDEPGYELYEMVQPHL